MILWIAMGVAAAVAAAAALAPLFAGRRSGEAPDPAAIYRDQLRELESEIDRGLVSPSDAEAARVEISRRLLHASRDDETGAGSGRGWTWAAASLIVVAPVAAVGMYVFLGSPSLPDQPLAAREAAPTEQADFPTLIARVEDHLAENPDDGRGWEVVAPAYLRMGRFSDAAEAFANASRILGATAGRETNYGEALVWQNQGLVDEEARAAFQRAVAQDPSQVRARFYLARALEQEGATDEAIAAWRELLADAPGSGAPWVDAARTALAGLTGETPPIATPQTATPPRGPDAETIAAAAEMSAEDRQVMIEGMVESLAARLEESPGDAEGWARLIRSYVVLDQRSEAAASLEKAQAALQADAEGTALVLSAARALGLVQPGAAE